MENNSLINNQSTISPLADSDMSLTHFSEWSRADKIAFASFILGLIGAVSILFGLVSIWYSHKSERREKNKIMREQRLELIEKLDILAPQKSNSEEI